jgi:hypothetical protein
MIEKHIWLRLKHQKYHSQIYFFGSNIPEFLRLEIKRAISSNTAFIQHLLELLVICSMVPILWQEDISQNSLRLQRSHEQSHTLTTERNKIVIMCNIYPSIFYEQTFYSNTYYRKFKHIEEKRKCAQTRKRNFKIIP